MFYNVASPVPTEINHKKDGSLIFGQNCDPLEFCCVILNLEALVIQEYRMND